MKIKSIRNSLTRYKLTLLLIFGVGVLAFALLIFVNHRIIGSDDTVFPVQILPFHTVFDWIQYRYTTWSGRIFSEGFVYLFSPAPFIYWQLVMIAMYGIFSAMIFTYYRLFTTKRTPVKDYLMLAVALCLPFLVDRAVLQDSTIWMTGSIVYFWMTALALIAFYPIAYYIRLKKRPSWPITAAGVLSSIIAASSQEQVGVALCALSFTFIVYSFISGLKQGEKVIPWYAIILFAITVLAFAVSYLAPGNDARLHLELAQWLPDLYTTPIAERALYSYRWILEALINHSGYLLVASWLLMIGLFFAKIKKGIIDHLVMLCLLVMSILMLTKGTDITIFWFEFYASWKPADTNALVALNVMPWGIGLFVTVIAPLLLFKKKPIGALLTTLYSSAFATAAIMVLSPTMYASGWRTIFVPSVMLIFITYILLDKILDAYWRYRYTFVAVIFTLALSQYVYQVARLIKNS